jgi:membrane associated rhomboid family serine protease
MRKFSFNQLTNSYKEADASTRLIYINVIVFVLIHLIGLVLWLFAIHGGGTVLVDRFFAVPTNITYLAYRPWTIFTYMFMHTGLLHLLFNMVALYYGGQLFSQFLGQKKIWSVYINGGLAGALLYIFSYNLFPVFGDAISVSKAIGASASIMAIIAGIGAYMPNMQVRLFFLGNVKLKWIIIFLVVVDLLSISQSNSGGHISHLGGALYGYLFAIQLKKGNDISKWVWPVSDFFKRVFNSPRTPKFKVKHSSGIPKSDYQYNAQKKKNQDQLDAILDKISKSGYDSLTKEEKNFLFKQSN